MHDFELNNKRLRVELLDKKRLSHSFTGYLKERADDYKEKGKRTMYKKVTRFTKELEECFNGEVYFEDVDMTWMRRLDTFLIKIPNVPNTRVKKFKFLKGYYQNAINEGRADAPNPFTQYKINADPVKKVKLTVAQVKAIEELLLTGPADVARDLFLFSFYAKGNRFENCVTIKREDIKNGRIYWQSNKGKKWLSVAIHGKLQAIIDKYKENKTPFLFPILKEELDDAWQMKDKIASANTLVNKYLKVVAEFAEIKEHLTFHIARHTFAFHLKKNTNSIQVIKEAMGHSDYKTTEIYLNSLDDEAIDPDIAKVYGY
jgi:integrase